MVLKEIKQETVNPALAAGISLMSQRIDNLTGLDPQVQRLMHRFAEEAQGQVTEEDLRRATSGDNIALNINLGALALAIVALRNREIPEGYTRDELEGAIRGFERILSWDIHRTIERHGLMPRIPTRTEM